MKYFTMKYWSDGGGTDEEWERTKEIGKAYDAYIARIRHLLPADLQRLSGMGGDISLNDGIIRSLDASFSGRELSIALDGEYERGADLRNRRIYLHYTGVDSLRINLDTSANCNHAGPSEDVPEQGQEQGQSRATEDLDGADADTPAGYGSLFHASGYGDHGFDEVDILANGLFEHRMLFSSGNEIAIQFRAFSLRYEDL